MVSQQLQVRIGGYLNQKCLLPPEKPLLLQAGDLNLWEGQKSMFSDVQSEELGVATSSRQLREHGGG